MEKISHTVHGHSTTDTWNTQLYKKGGKGEWRLAHEFGGKERSDDPSLSHEVYWRMLDLRDEEDTSTYGLCSDMRRDLLKLTGGRARAGQTLRNHKIGDSLRRVIRYPTLGVASAAMRKRSALIRGCQTSGARDACNYVVRPNTTPSATTHYGTYLIRAVYPGGGTKQERYSDEIEVWEHLVVDKAWELSRPDTARRNKRKRTSEDGQTTDEDTDPDEPTPKWASREDIKEGARTRHGS